MKIVVTGAAGFIGSCLVKHLNQLGHKNLVLVDDFNKPGKSANLAGAQYLQQVDRMAYLADPGSYEAAAIFHIGARTDTTEFNTAIFDELNLNYSKILWQHATEHQIPFIYASSAATYGDGELGFDDLPERIPTLKPLNPYGQSKQDFDTWVLDQEAHPPFWVGLKFFNVFGPNEYHKGRMASVVFHTFHQIQRTGKMRLFESHRPDFKDGEQSRDFVYIKDVLRVIQFWFETQQQSGIYNLGTGTARTFNDLSTAVFRAMNLEPQIDYFPTPDDLRETYQYYTCANMDRTLKAGYSGGFHTLEDAVTDYVKQYLIPNLGF
ncbi:MAG: ADP-glyceromanno-heptose 6-epimerase [Flavobacteriales bacterium]|nr:ADP-glyceromanno-heptose 6-epimerase [Bacteroidota bacterium]MCB9241050.1 ADP-glyceromanno-heptose 6-epimerase [Flavobacteriales bacterium]